MWLPLRTFAREIDGFVLHFLAVSNTFEGMQERLRVDMFLQDDTVYPLWWLLLHSFAKWMILLFIFASSRNYDITNEEIQEHFMYSSSSDAYTIHPHFMLLFNIRE